MSLRLTRSRRTAVLAGAFSVVLAVSACSSGGDDGDSGGGSTADCAQFESYGDLKGKTVTVYTGIVTPEDELADRTPTSRSRSAPARRSSTRATRPSRPRSWYAPRPATRRTSRSCRSPACSSSWSPPARSMEAPPEVVANVDKFWSQDWKTYGTVDGKFYAAPLGANVKSLGLVLADRVPGEGLQGARPPSTSSRRCPTRSPRSGKQAVVRRHRQRRGDRLAGHRLDGRHDAPDVRAGGRTTSGSSTRSRSTAPDRSRRLDAVGQVPEERQVRQRRPRRRQEHRHAPRSRTAACRSWTAPARCTARRASTRPTGPRAPRWPRTATSSRSTSRARTRRRQAGPRWRRVHRGVRRPARGAGVPDLPVRPTPGPTPRRPAGGSVVSAPTRASSSSNVQVQPDRQAVGRRSCRTRRRSSASTART